MYLTMTGDIGMMKMEALKLHSPNTCLILTTGRVQIVPREKDGVDVEQTNRLTNPNYSMDYGFPIPCRLHLCLLCNNQ